ncbi:lipopolysaccharide biosynthesis protein [Metabacillus schmidteae]|uniref:lipopolysaccharide biosynthesis protein n=1 Tax=Metabacillus schmidteae TaxID=2730405 RepID=UPI0015892411|nr:oligosaccharide flippase family protein [Metabacillus schmidteae]
MKKILNNTFFKSIITLTTGSVLAQLISFVAAPIMTRLYSTDEIGLYTLILTSVTMFGGVLCGRYDISIVTSKKEDDVFSLIKLSFFISVISSIVISLGFFIYYYNVDNSDVPYFLVVGFIFVLLFTTGINNILISFNNRNKEYKLMTSVQVVRTFGKEFSMTSLGLLNTGSIGLLISQIIGQILGLNRQSKSLKKYITKILSVSKTNMLKVAKLYIKQPLYSVPAIFANNFSYSSINLFVGYLFGLTTLGYYAISFKILGLPLGVISNNVSKVFLEKASREYDATNQYKSTFLKTSFFLLLIAIPMVICMIILAPPVFRWLFGEGWEVSGQYVKILAPMFGIRFIVSPLTIGMIISNKQKFELLIQILFMLISVIGFVITLFANFTIEQYLLFISISFSIVYILYYLLLLKFSRNTLNI